MATAGCHAGAGEQAKPLRLMQVAMATEWLGTRDRAPTAELPEAPAGGAWVLHIGDSFVDAGFQQSLRPHFREAGTPYVVRSKTATYTTTWAHSAELDELLSRKPSLVIVTLGANEFDMPIPTLHVQAIETIARKVAGAHASCVWTAPPMWKPDTGISAVIHDHCNPCLFFDSDAVLGGLSPDERASDHIHPNRRGGRRWAEVLWGWLAEHRDAQGGPWALEPFERRGT